MARMAASNQKQLKLSGSGPSWKPKHIISKSAPKPHFSTEHGVLFHNDCLAILPHIESESIDTVFADPPFNIGKEYGDKVNDKLPDAEYVEWCHKWLAECIRILKPGGSLFVYNLPKWNVLLGAYLTEQGMTFRHWIAVSIKMLLPIPGRLYPAHYSLIYYCKGKKPKTFRNIRTPIETCRHCGKEIKDYGGHRGAMNPNGVNLTDVWTDIPPVRHRKFKTSKRKANQLSTKLLTRVIELSTVPGDVVLDPFGGSGTTFDVCETRHRHWIGMELQDCDIIEERLSSNDVAQHQFSDFIEG